MHLDTAIGGVNVPIAWFILFNMTVVMVLTPLFDTVVIPKLESWDFTVADPDCRTLRTGDSQNLML